MSRKIEVTGLWIYPVKSMRGIAVEKARVEEKGFSHDRRWMLVDENGKFLSQRKHPELTQFVPSFDSEDQLHITFEPDYSSIHIPLTADFANVKMVNVWSDTFEAGEAPDEVNSWFSEKLGFKCSLVANTSHTKRALSQKYVAGERQVSFADGYPYLLANETSLDSFNEHLESPIDMWHFRPNIIVRTGIAYEEDSWNTFDIGKVPFIFAKPCARCVMINVDPESGTSDPSILKTLAKHRKAGNKVLFGINIVALEAGELRVGEELIIRT